MALAEICEEFGTNVSADLCDWSGSCMVVTMTTPSDSVGKCFELRAMPMMHTALSNEFSQAWKPLTTMVQKRATIKTHHFTAGKGASRVCNRSHSPGRPVVIDSQPTEGRPATTDNQPMYGSEYSRVTIYLTSNQHRKYNIYADTLLHPCYINGRMGIWET